MKHRTTTAVNYQEYEIPNAKALVKCKKVMWEGIHYRTEGKGNSIRFFIYITKSGIKRIKKRFPFMKIIKLHDE